MSRVAITANNLLEAERNLITSFENGDVHQRVEALREYSTCLIAHHNAVEGAKRHGCCETE